MIASYIYSNILPFMNRDCVVDSLQNTAPSGECQYIQKKMDKITWTPDCNSNK